MRVKCNTLHQKMVWTQESTEKLKKITIDYSVGDTEVEIRGQEHPSK